MTDKEKLIGWLLEGDVAIQYRTRKELLGESEDKLKALRSRIPEEGFGKRFLDQQKPDGHWGGGYYQHKWISSHYTLLDLKHLGSPVTEEIMKAIEVTLSDYRAANGAISCNPRIDSVDICVNGMFLNFACYFGIEEDRLKTIVDYLLSNQMADGGYNCQSSRSGAVHSSLHSTIGVLEGYLEYEKAGYTYRLAELQKQRKESQEFILKHHLFKSNKTGIVIHEGMTMLSFPSRWKFDLLRGLEYFVDADHPYDERMSDAIEVLKEKQRKDGTWPVQSKHSGQVHFDMEKTGGASRFNTLRALKVLSAYDNLS